MISRALTFAIKYLLPLLALLAIAYAGYRTYAGRPNDQLLAPVIAPATTTASAATTARVAGAGVVEPSSETIGLAPNSSGVVMRVNVVPGDTVKKGQVLFTLDGRELAAQLSTRQADVSALRANVRVAEAELADRQALLALYQGIGDARAMVREELLRRQGAVDLAQARMRAAQAQIQSAQAAVQQTRTQIDLLTVRSPLDATVLQVRLKVGEFAAAASGTNQALLTLGNTTPLHVRVDYDEADVARLPQGQDAILSARGASGAPITGRFVRAEPIISPKRSLTNEPDERVDTRVLQVIYALPLNAKGFYVGQQVDAFVNAQAAR
jgi:HlyD family secretion protein